MGLSSFAGTGQFDSAKEWETISKRTIVPRSKVTLLVFVLVLAEFVMFSSVLSMRPVLPSKFFRLCFPYLMIGSGSSVDHLILFDVKLKKFDPA